MGACLSCCRRQKKEDQKPLLGHDEQDADSGQPTSDEALKKFTAALGAISAGKLPSETQTEHFLKSCLQSDMLRYDAHFGGPGPLSAHGRKVLEDSKEFIEALLQVGMEKNYDDCIQELYFHYSLLSRRPASVNVDVKAVPGKMNGDAVVNAIPSTSEVDDDVKTASKSIRTLTSLLFTSTAFRMILGDFFTTSRELVADAFAKIGSVAAVVEAQAQTAEHTLRPSNKEDDDALNDPVHDIQDGTARLDQETRRHWKELSEDAPDRVRATFVSRFQEILERTQQEPAYRASALTLLSLLQKYYGRFYHVASNIPQVEGEAPSVVVSTQIDLDPNLLSALKHLRQLMGRFAKNQTLDPLFQTIDKTLHDLAQAADHMEIRNWFEEVGVYMQRTLNQEGWIRSHSAQREAEAIYDRARELIRKDPNAAWVRDLRRLGDQANDFFSALKADKSTQRLLRAAESLRKDIEDTTRITFGIIGDNGAQMKKLKKEIRQDVFGWFMPRLLRLLRAVPMPRVEFVSSTVEAAVDSVILSSASASFLPDHINVQSSEEFYLDFSEDNYSAPRIGAATGDQRSGGLQSYVRTKIHMDGIRLNAHGISYYVNYHGPWNILGWEDHGLMDIDVGAIRETSQGLELDLEVDLDATNHRQDEEEKSLFRILDVKLDIPGLQFKIRNSRHWILNRLLVAPLLGPVVRQAVHWVLANQLRRAFEQLDKKLYTIHQSAIHKAGTESRPSLTDYWEGLMEQFDSDVDQQDEVGEGVQQAIAETHTTMKGVVVTRTDDSMVAIGAGEQILPGKGGPALKNESVQQVARDTLDDVERGVQSGLEGVESARVQTKTGIERAKEAERERRSFKRKEQRQWKEGGWRSDAFDLSS